VRAPGNLALAGVLVFAGIIGVLTWQAIRATCAQPRAFRVPAAIKDLDSAVTEADAGHLGHLLTGSPDYLSPYEGALRPPTIRSNRSGRGYVEPEPKTTKSFPRCGGMVRCA